MVAQCLGRQPQVAATAVLQVEADKVDQAGAGLLQLRAQELAAKVARNLHHALGRLGTQDLQPLRRQQAVRHAMGQRLLKEGASVKQGDGGHQSAAIDLDGRLFV